LGGAAGVESPAQSCHARSLLGLGEVGASPTATGWSLWC